MSTQNYANHRHNPRLTGVGSGLSILSLVSFALRWYGIGGRYTMAGGLFFLFASIQVLFAISRVYTTKLQDRIIKLEMRLRAAAVLTPPQQAALWQLEKPQIIALRFASDGELAGLIERAGREKLSANQIKQAITTWLADGDRT